MLQFIHQSERLPRQRTKYSCRLVYHWAMGLLAQFKQTILTDCPLIKADASLPIRQQCIQEPSHNETIVSLFFTYSTAEQKVTVVQSTRTWTSAGSIASTNTTANKNLHWKKRWKLSKKNNLKISLLQFFTEQHPFISTVSFLSSISYHLATTIS